MSGSGRWHWRLSLMSVGGGCGRQRRRVRRAGGGILATARAPGIAEDTIRKGITELETGRDPGRGRVRRPAAGETALPRPIPIWSRISSVWWTPVRAVIPSCRCGGRQRACASSPMAWSGSVTKSATARPVSARRECLQSGFDAAGGVCWAMRGSCQGSPTNTPTRLPGTPSVSVLPADRVCTRSGHGVSGRNHRESKTSSRVVVAGSHGAFGVDQPVRADPQRAADSGLLRASERRRDVLRSRSSLDSPRRDTSSPVSREVWSACPSRDAAMYPDHRHNPNSRSRRSPPTAAMTGAHHGV